MGNWQLLFFKWQPIIFLLILLVFFLICTIVAKNFVHPFPVISQKLGVVLTFIVIMIDVCKLKFEIYYCHP
jgi:hypothetical protein